ncbi:MAG: hypothetical protein FWE09_05130 [Treponema sp.]|nr:hypothetical protein [Treponema sp.]
MNESTRESIRFFTGADYLVVNNLLWANKINLRRGIEAAHRNNAGVIREAMEMTPEVRWGVPKEEGEKLLEAYRRRTPDEITEASEAKIIETAINDIRTICDSMRPADSEMTLYRNVEEEHAIKELTVGKEVDLLGLTSTSSTGQKIDYGNGSFKTAFCIYEIKISVGLPVLIVENDYREENEVILPPMRYRISGTRDNGKIAALEAIKPLDISLIIKNAKMALNIRN